MSPITNSTKALVIALVNAVLGAAVAFGVDLSTEQVGAILAVALTYKSSPKRIPDGTYVFEPDPGDDA